ncbi:MAG: hypothetical protein AB1815_08075 [Bacillota bacterium]
MKKFHLKGKTAVALVLLLALSVYAVQKLLNPVGIGDIKVQQLSQLSGTEPGTVVRLYKAVRDWDELLKNILVYQQLLSLVEGTPAEKQLFRLIPQYDAADLYVAYDYFISNGLPTGRIEELLEQRAKGDHWNTILAGCSISKAYSNYQVLEKSELQRLLGLGHLPEDIIEADSLARAQDLPLEDVLQLKTPDQTWAEIAAALGCRTGEFHRSPSLSVPGVEVSDQGFPPLVAASNLNAEERKRDDQARVKTELGLTDGELETYLSQGYNPQEVRNAYRLAKANSVTPAEVLAQKKAGLSWEEILAAYPKK